MNKFDEVYNRIISEAEHQFKYKQGEQIFVALNNEVKKGIIQKCRYSGDVEDYFISFESSPSTKNSPISYPEWRLGKSQKQAIENSNKFDENLFKKEVQTEDGECAAGAGITTNSTFGPPSDYPSVVQPSQKTADNPGVSTKDINQLYTPHMGTPIIGQFRRYTAKKRKKKK